MNGPRRAPVHNPNADALMAFALLGAAVVVVGAAWAAAELAHLAEHTLAPAHNPAKWLVSVVKGHWHWPMAATWWAAGEAALVLVIAALVAMVVMRWQAGRVYVDSRARLLGRDRPSLRRYVDPKAAPVAAEHGPGLQVGRDVMGGRMVRATWEDTIVVIAGARMGKTTCMAVPQVLGAPGVVYCTSNKRDLHDLTAEARRQRGQVWVFDPQGIAAPKYLRAGGTRSTPARASRRHGAPPTCSPLRPGPPTPAVTPTSTPPAKSCSPPSCSPPLQATKR